MRALIHNDRGKTQEYTNVERIARESDSLHVTRKEGEQEEEFTIPEGMIVEVIAE